MEHIPIEGGKRLPTGAERRESLFINSVVIPANDSEPLRRQQIETANLDHYRGAVGGNLEAVSLLQPSSSLYCNEEGKLLGLPTNSRATMLLWAHFPALRFRDYIAGDALLTGPVDHDGWDTNLPEELTRVFDADELRVEVRTYGDPQWYGNEQHFGAWTTAYASALELARRWTLVEDIRVLPVEPPTPRDEQA